MNKITSGLGHVGSCASVACAIHCIAMPFVIAMLPALGIGWLASKKFEIVALVVAIGCSLLSLCWGYRTHGRLRGFGIMASGAMWLLLAHWQHNHWFSFFGGACLVLANVVNRRLCNSCNHCENHE